MGHIGQNVENIGKIGQAHKYRVTGSLPIFEDQFNLISRPFLRCFKTNFF